MYSHCLSGIRGQLLPHSQLLSMRASKRLQTPFFDKLRHEKIHSEARLRELKQRLLEEQDRERRVIEETLDGFDLDRPLSPSSTVQLEAASQQQKVDTPDKIDLTDQQSVNSELIAADTAVEDESLMAAIRYSARQMTHNKV